MPGADREITSLLEEVRRGDRGALSRLWEAVAPQVRVIARRQLAGEAHGRFLRASELVNEAYWRLFGKANGPVELENSAHLFGAVARAMRQVLVEQARSRKRQGQEIDLDRIPDLRSEATTWGWEGDLEALDRALRVFEGDPRNARKAEIVDLRFFNGHAVSEIAEILGLSVDTVKRDLRFARAWLMREMKRGRTR